MTDAEKLQFVLDMVSTPSKAAQVVRDLLEEIDQHKARIASLEQQIANLQGMEKDARRTVLAILLSQPERTVRITDIALAQAIGPLTGWQIREYKSPETREIIWTAIKS